MLCEKDKRRELLYLDLFLFVYLKSILKCVHFKKNKKNTERPSLNFMALKCY